MYFILNWYDFLFPKLSYGQDSSFDETWKFLALKCEIVTAGFDENDGLKQSKNMVYLSPYTVL